MSLGLVDACLRLATAPVLMLPPRTVISIGLPGGVGFRQQQQQRVDKGEEHEATDAGDGYVRDQRQ